MDHIILGCMFSWEVSATILTWLELADLLNGQEENTIWWWLHSRKRVPAGQTRHGFDSLVILVSSSLWKERNARTFQRKSFMPVALTQQILEDANEWLLAGYKHLG